MDVTFNSCNEKVTDITIGAFCNLVQKSASVESVKHCYKLSCFLG